MASAGNATASANAPAMPKVASRTEDLVMGHSWWAVQCIDSSDSGAENNMRRELFTPP